MATNQEIIDALETAKQYYSDELNDLVPQMEKGCATSCKSLSPIYSVFTALRYKIWYDEFDDVTQRLYRCLMNIMGEYVPTIAPTVNAGANSTITLPTNTKIFNGAVTQGSAPIVSTIWTQVSGPNTATLSGQNTLTLTVSNLIQGSYVFKLTAIDENNMSGEDTVTLTVAQASLQAFYGAKSTNTVLDYAGIISGSAVTFTPNGDVTIPYEVPTQSYMWFAIPSNQPDKNYYLDLADALNQAFIGSEDDLYGAPILVTGETNYDFYITNYLTSYSKINPVRGLRFQTI